MSIGRNGVDEGNVSRFSYEARSIMRNISSILIYDLSTRNMVSWDDIDYIRNAIC